MKKIFTFLLLSFIAAAAFAFTPQTRLTVSSAFTGSLRITVDGNNYQMSNSRNADELVISNLVPGSHSIRIYRQAGRSNGRGNIYNNANSQMLYSGTVNLRPQYHTDLVINRFGKVFTDEVQMTGRYFDDNNYPMQYNQQMQQQNFDALKSAVKREAFDDTRLNIAKQAGAANYFSAAQVRELLQIFSFDESRLELAKFLYSRTTDKENYFTVNDAFTYSDSKNKLSDYIRQQP